MRDVRCRVFLDTEYTHTAHPILISVGLAAEDGRELYVELTDGWRTADCSVFVMDEVLPLLQRTPEVSMTRAMLRERLPQWLHSLGRPTTIVYDLRTDWHLLSDLYDDLPNQFGIEGEYLKWRDSEMEQRFEEILEAWFVTHGPRHDALVDARGLRDSVLAVEQQFGSRLV